MSEKLRDLIAHLPHKPGVYRYYNQIGDLLYVGKAKDLAKRVGSYFMPGKNRSPWTELLIQEIADIQIIEVTTELEAFLLENSLIKSLRPKYNLQLRDDKTFPFLRISPEPFPTFTITRRVKNDKARYLGPYFSATYLRGMLKILQSLYGIKVASEKSYEARSNVPQQIGLGARNLDNQTAYRTNVEQAIQFLSAPQPKMERILKQSMQQAVQEEAFERAAILRDRLLALTSLRDEQSLFGTQATNRDYVGIAQTGKLISVSILVEREGKIVNHKDFLFEFRTALTPTELTEFVLDYLYVNGLTLPKEIIIGTLPENKSLLLESLKTQSGKKVTLVAPQRGELKTRLATAQENAEYQLHLETLKKNRREHGLADLAKVLSLPHLPKRIEAFDISNLGASSIVGASVVFINGQPAKQEYRKYKITTPVGQDDFASMRELVYRRISNKDRPLPDLLLIDGGKGQLSAALDALTLAQVKIPVMSLAKKEELIFLPDKTEPIALAHDSDALLLLTAIRNEVHRYVITFHRQRRKKSFLPSGS